MDRATLEDLVIRFTDAFNRNDLDGVMAFMADDAVYEEFTGAITQGREAIPQIAAFISEIDTCAGSRPSAAPAAGAAWTSSTSRAVG